MYLGRGDGDLEVKVNKVNKLKIWCCHQPSPVWVNWSWMKTVQSWGRQRRDNPAHFRGQKCVPFQTISAAWNTVSLLYLPFTNLLHRDPFIKLIYLQNIRATNNVFWAGCHLKNDDASTVKVIQLQMEYFIQYIFFCFDASSGSRPITLCITLQTTL